MRKGGIMARIWSVNGWRFCASLALKLVYGGGAITGPVVMRRILEILENGEESSEAYVWAACLFVVSFFGQVPGILGFVPICSPCLSEARLHPCTLCSARALVASP